MAASKGVPAFSEDPRRLRDLLARSCELAEQHAVPSVVVGIAAREGEPLVPEVIDFLSSALRVEDAIFRMTRERAVLFLTDVDCARARAVLTRLLTDFSERFPSTSEPEIDLGFYELLPEARGIGLKEVLPELFSERGRSSATSLTH